MFPLSGDDAATYGKREFQAVDLARADFAQMMGGTNARRGGAGAHPIALVACDDAVDPARAIHHLVDDVEVPAVIGFRTSKEVIDLATSTLIPRGVLGVAALNTSPMITSLPRPSGQPRMIWRTTYSAAQTALPIGLLVPEVLEPELRAQPKVLGKEGLLRVAVVRQDDAAGIGFADVLFRSLRYNGRSALENEGSYHEFVYSFDAGPDKRPEYEKIAAKVLAYAPHVVVYFGADDAFLRILEPLERGWRDAAYRPRYVKPSALSPAILSFVGKNADRRHRFLSLTSVSTTAANARFVSRYNETFSEGITRTFSPNSSYDAFYVVAYATYALGDQPVTGASLARAIGRLVPPGRAVDVGPSGIFDALNTLAAGSNIDLHGATGRLDFDLETGDAAVDLAILCINADAQGMAFDNVESGLVYDAAANKLRGALHCP